ncbi:hypothetical protein [Vibrio sp. FF145]
MDIELNEANLADGAGFSNNAISGAILPKYAIEALPVQYELPTLIIFDAYGKVSGFLFSEAAENYGESK